MLTKQAATEIVAEKLMEWKRSAFAGCWDTPASTQCDFDPFADANALKQVRDRLAEQGWLYAMHWLPNGRFSFSCYLPLESGNHAEQSPTEAHAVMSVALKVAGCGEEIECDS